MRISDWSSDVCSSDLEAGGWVVAQDAESSVVWGVPGSVAREGLASAILPPDRMGRYFASQMAREIAAHPVRSEEHTSELQSLMRNSYAVFCLKKKTKYTQQPIIKYKYITKNITHA